MKILVAYHFFPHYRKPVFEALNKECDGEIDVYYCGDRFSDKIDGTIKPWVPPKNFIHTPVRKIFGKTYTQVGLIKECLFGDYDAVIILSDMNNFTTWALGILIKFKRTRLLFWGHGWIDEHEASLKASIRKAYFSLADGILLYGRRARRLAISSGIPKENIWVIYNSLDAKKQLDEAQKVSKSDVRLLKMDIYGDECIKVISCISRLTKLRRLDLLIDALSLIEGGSQKFGLLLIGDGSEKEALKQKAEKLGVKIYCTGAVYEEEQIARYMSISDLAVAPGKVGLTAMHSLAYGVPVITHGDMNNQMPESEAIIKGVTGDFFQINNVGDLSRCIQDWFQYENDELRQNRACSCQRMIEVFYNPENQVKLILDAVRNINNQLNISEHIQVAELYG